MKTIILYILSDMNYQTTLFIHHHLGLGDHIICNGLVRTLLNESRVYSGVCVFAKEVHKSKVSRMFDDDDRISVISIPKDKDEIEFTNNYISSNFVTNFIRCGFGGIYNFYTMGITKNFDEVFYLMAGIPHETKWTNFKIRRDYGEESRVYGKLNPNKEKYIFVHDDYSRGMVITPNNPKNLKIIKNDITESIFDMTMVLEGASEIHCMESSMKCLIETVRTNCPLYLHTTIRPDGQGSNPYIVASSKKNWILI
jgi:hypothetical protein